MTTVAVLGLGAMGSRLARSLLDAGHEVVTYNRTPGRADALESAGATQAATPRQAATQAQFVISMVTDDAASRAVWLDTSTGALGGLGDGTIAIESSTVTPMWVQELAERLAGRGVGFLDAPVVGSRPQAEAGHLVYLVGGDPTTLSRAEPILRTVSGAIHHVGPIGQGTMMKLAVNALFGVQVAAMGELLGMLRRLGVDEETAIGILDTLPVTSPAARAAAAAMMSRDFAPRYPIDLVEKDLRYAEATAHSVDASVPVATAVRDVYARARDGGFGGDNIVGVARLFT